MATRADKFFFLFSPLFFFFFFGGGGGGGGGKNITEIFVEKKNLKIEKKKVPSRHKYCHPAAQPETNLCFRLA